MLKMMKELLTKISEEVLARQSSDVISVNNISTSSEVEHWNG
jgi:hypothetical protein